LRQSVDKGFDPASIESIYIGNYSSDLFRYWSATRWSVLPEYDNYFFLDLIQYLRDIDWSSRGGNPGLHRLGVAPRFYKLSFLLGSVLGHLLGDLRPRPSFEHATKRQQEALCKLRRIDS